MGKLFKNVLRVVDPVGSAIAKKNKHSWFGRVHGRVGSWGYLKKKWGLSSDKLFGNSAKSAASSSISSGMYGPTGSVVGRF